MIRKNIRENKPRRSRSRQLFLVTVLLLLPLAVYLSFALAYQRQTYPQTFICNLDLGRQSLVEAEKTLNEFTEQNQPAVITLKHSSQTLSLTLESLRYQPAVEAQKVFWQNRWRFLLGNLPTLNQFTQPLHRTVWGFTLDEAELDQKIVSLSAQFYLPPIDPQIKIGDDKKISVEAGKNGRVLNSLVLKRRIQERLACPEQNLTLDLPWETISSEISLEIAQSAKVRAEKLLNKAVRLDLDGQSWQITDEELISFLDWRDGVDRSKVAVFVGDLARAVDKQPENAAFAYENGRVTVFKPDREGIILRENELHQAIINAVVNLEKGQEKIELTLPVTRTPAKIGTGDVNSLGISQRLSQGSSFFRGSIPNRVHNLSLASLRLNGLLVAPGEEFSFNQALGDVSAGTGYQQAYIIKDGRTILGDGGGVCQVSTTLFRAVLNAGLPVTERHAHAYRVHYYEEDLGPGFDATVFSPAVDLKFKNDTANYILIQSQVDKTKKQLTFEFYGTPDNRQVEINKARVWDKQPPPPDLYQEDPTLPVGTVKQVDWKAWGAKVSFDYKVSRNGEVVQEKTFYSSYRPWQAVYLKGTRP